MLCVLIFRMSDKTYRFLRNSSWQFYFTLRAFSSHTTYYVVCIILCMSGGTYSLKSTSNDRFFFFFDMLFMASLFTLRVSARNLLRGSHRRNIFIFSFWCLTWDLNSGITSNKPRHNLLHYGDLRMPFASFKPAIARKFSRDANLFWINARLTWLSMERWRTN